MQAHIIKWNVHAQNGHLVRVGTQTHSATMNDFLNTVRKGSAKVSEYYYNHILCTHEFIHI